MPVVNSPSSSVAEALLRMGGMYGSAWRNGVMLTEVVQVQATMDQAVVPVPLVGQTKQGNKPGRETRSGTITYQKIDGKWELQVWQSVSQTLAQRRAARDAGTPLQAEFSLILEYDDPDALGIEKWQLDGCQIYRLNLGFNIGDDLTQQQIPFTWESETPIYVFTATIGAGGVLKPTWYPGYGPPPTNVI